MALNTDTTEWSRLADKYEVRNYVRECGLEDTLVPQFGLWNNMDEVEFDKLPNSFKQIAFILPEELDYYDKYFDGYKIEGRT